jgi:integrase
VDALNRIVPVTPGYFFWSGNGEIDTASGNWRRSLRKLFSLAGVDGGHPHRFRDTFAVELLMASVPLERVSILLGHSSVRVTEKHYSPGFTRDRNNWKPISNAVGQGIRLCSLRRRVHQRYMQKLKLLTDRSNYL